MVGTIFEGSRTPLQLWFYAIFMFTTTRNGVAAKELQRQLGVTYKTAWRMAGAPPATPTSGRKKSCRDPAGARAAHPAGARAGCSFRSRGPGEASRRFPPRLACRVPAPAPPRPAPAGLDARFIPRRFIERVGDCPVDKLDIRKAETGRALAHRGGKRQRRPANFGQQRPADATPPGRTLKTVDARRVGTCPGAREYGHPGRKTPRRNGQGGWYRGATR